MKYLLLLLPFFVNGQTTTHTPPPYTAIGPLVYKTDTVPFAGGTLPLSVILTSPGLLSVGAKDFDYTIYTFNALKTIDNTDSLHELFLLRKIAKNGDELKIVSLTNTADCLTYKLHYIGWQSDARQFLYTGDHQEMIWIDPCMPMVIIGRTKYY